MARCRSYGVGDRVDSPTPTVRVEDKERASLKDALWLPPELVAEIYVRGWGSAGVLRHASFKGLCADKSAADL